MYRGSVINNRKVRERYRGPRENREIQGDKRRFRDLIFLKKNICEGYKHMRLRDWEMQEKYRNVLKDKKKSRKHRNKSEIGNVQWES
jgi:hypothetical protein